MFSLNEAVLRQVRRRDRIARWVITLGGALVIASVVAILVVICAVTLPLFRGARATVIASLPLPPELPLSLRGSDQPSRGARGEGERGNERAVQATTPSPPPLSRKGRGEPPSPVAVGGDLVEMRTEEGGDVLTAYAIAEDGGCRFFDLSAAAQDSAEHYRLLAQERLAPPGDGKDPSIKGQTIKGQTIKGVEHCGSMRYTLLWSGGGVSLVEVLVHPSFDVLGKRHVEHGVRVMAEFPPEKGPPTVKAVARAGEGGAATCVRLLANNTLAVVRRSSTEVMGESEITTHRMLISNDIPGPVSALTLNQAGKMLFVGTSDGGLGLWEFDDAGQLVYHDNATAFRGARQITALAMVFGDLSLAVGDDTGKLTIWFEIHTPETRKLRFIREIATHHDPVAEILPAARDKTLLSLDDVGTVGLDYMTSGRHLLTLPTERRIRALGYSPRGNAVVGLTDDNALRVWHLDNPHPEVSWSTLFGAVHYEGYAEPDYKWQSSGDEPKYSLVPIIFGTLKSTFYAMFLAVPLSLLAAIYVSRFTTPAFKWAIKPIVEVMAAVPSVVVGFLILLWLGPKLGRWIVAGIAGMVTVPLVFVLFMFAWQWLRKYDWLKRLESGYEFLVMVPVLCLGAAAAVWASGPLEHWAFHGSFSQWLFEMTHKPYEPLNSLTVALGLGFAVIPVIFSLSEDAISNIPQDLTTASLALGASRWQTLRRVVLPSASPGIFAAIMVGFGRGVGETMIVFMATGNTPILDWSPFSGFRTLSANIAVEMPEAPVDGTLYRVLFLCAVLLFLLTFLLNTVAELVRHRLRQRYGRY